jgi:hypothetical protein
MKTYTILGFLLLAGAAAAQNTATFPSDHASIPNGRSSIYWFPYSYGVSRMMAVYESWDVNVPAGRQINRIGVRAEGTTLSYGKSLQLEVRMGQTEKTSANLLSNYDSNYFGTPTTVFGPALFTLPDLNNPLNPNPTGNMVWLNLTTPYTFDPNKNLLVEWRVIANNNGGAQFQYTLDSADFESPLATGPQGCTHSGSQIPLLESRRTAVGDTWYCDLSRAPANQLATWFVSVGAPLVPQYSLAPFLPGIAPACQGQIPFNNLFAVSATTGGGGSHTFSVPIPNRRIFNNMILSSQVLCTDVFAPGGFVVSNGDQIEIGIEPATAVIYHQGSATNATGSVSGNGGINVITFFGHN